MKTSKSVFALSLLTTSLLVACGGGGSTAATPTTPKPPVVTGNTCTSVATGTSVANYVADTVSCGLGQSSATPAAMAPIKALAFLIKGTSAGTGYTATLASFAFYSLTGTTWAAFSAPTTGVAVDLTAMGWVAPTSQTTTSTATTLTDTFSNGAATRTTTNVTYFNLAGTPILCQTPLSATCAIPGNYPAGAAGYDHTNVPATDDYSLNTVDTYNNFASAAITDSTGLALTTLPTLGTTTFCENSIGGNGVKVYNAIVGAAVGAANYNLIYGAGRCTAANITSVLTNIAVTPETLSIKATGIAGVSVIVSNVNRSQIFATYQGKVYPGNFEPAGGWPAMVGAPPYVPFITMKNKTAINAELLAQGLPALP